MANITRLNIIKFLELLFVFVLIVLHYYSFSAEATHTAILTTSTIGGYFIILIGLFLGGFTGTPVNRRIDLFYSIVGASLFIIIGILNISHFNSVGPKTSYKDTGMVKACLCIVEGALFLIDAILTFRGEA